MVQHRDEALQTTASGYTGDYTLIAQTYLSVHVCPDSFIAPPTQFILGFKDITRALLLAKVALFPDAFLGISLPTSQP